MGRPDLKKVIDGLQEQGYRTDRAFPGERMPHIQKPAVAVALQKEEETSQPAAPINGGKYALTFDTLT